MTATLEHHELWSTMPGWGISANLLPPEIIAARRARAARKIVVAALVAVVILGAGGYTWAFFQDRSASSTLTAEQDNTLQLQRQQRKYNEVVQINGSVAQVQGQLAGLLGQDVDMAKLVSALLGKLPAGGTASQVSITMQAANAAASGATGAGAVLDSSGRPHVGAVTITGSCRSMNDVAQFVTALAGIPGVVGAFPTSQQSSGNMVQFTVQLTLTDEVYSHQYEKAGGK